MSMTRPAESIEVMKKTMMIRIAIGATMAVSGRLSSKVNRAASVWPSSTTGPVMLPGSLRSISMPVRPMMEIHTTVKMDGRASTPPMNSRTVRPREMRAMNMPTNGDQQIVQAQ